MNPAGQPVQLTVKNGQIVNQQRGVVQQQQQQPQSATSQQATTPQQQLQQQLQQQQNAANVQQIFLNSKNQQLVMVSRMFWLQWAFLEKNVTLWLRISFIHFIS